jgi:hypothetical protein
MNTYKRIGRLMIFENYGHYIIYNGAGNPIKNMWYFEDAIRWARRYVKET